MSDAFGWWARRPARPGAEGDAAEPEHPLGPSAQDSDGQRGRMARAFGAPRAHMPHVRQRVPPGALGASSGDSVALAGGPALRDPFTRDVVLAHEVAHSLTGADEAQATAMGVQASLHLRGAGPAPALGARAGGGGGLGLRRCDPDPVTSGASWRVTASQARSYLEAFERMSPADQEARINGIANVYDARTTVRRVLAALPAEDLDGRFRDTVRRVMDLIERRVVRESTGMTVAQMAQAQATFMDTAARARAAAASGGAPPSAAQVQQAQADAVASMGIGVRTVDRWSALDAAGQAQFRVRAALAVTSIVTRAAARAPELRLTAAQLHFRPDAIDQASDTRYAETDGAGGLNFGMDFVDAAISNPDYVLGTVVHEIYGHPAHGERMRESMTFQVFDQARTQTTDAYSAAARAAPATSGEALAYGYHGTEIYSELREYRYNVRAPAGSGVVQGDDPRDDVRDHVRTIATQFPANLARAFLRGLYARFRIDPRISPEALVLFTEAVEAQYPGANVLN
jgi:hypothetical protein